MRTVIANLILTVSAGCCLAWAEEAPATSEEPSTITFTNGDHLQGNLKAISKEVLTWNSPALAEPAELSIGQVLDLNKPAEAGMLDRKSVVVLTLKNDDVARGELISVDDDSILINTWYAGLMKFNRLMVAKIQILSQTRFHYQGPSNLDGWVQSDEPPAWEYSRQAFISKNRGSIARDNVLAEQCRVSFDVEWKSDSLNLRLYLFTPDPKDGSPDAGAEIMLQRSTIYYRSAIRRSYVNGANAPELQENEKAHIEILSSRLLGHTYLLLNGRMVGNWSDAELKDKNLGSAIHFLSYHSKPMRISNIRIGAWDGKVDQKLQATFSDDEDGPLVPRVDQPQTEENSRSMNLANGDIIEGEIKSITDGLITINTELGEIIMPVDRFSNLVLPGLGKEKNKIYNGDIRATFPDGTSLVFRLDDIQDDKLTGYSQNFGTAVFPLSGISRVEFHLYTKNDSRPTTRRDS